MLYEIAVKILEQEYRLAGRNAASVPEAAVTELVKRLEKTASAYVLALLYDPHARGYDAALARRRLFRGDIGRTI